MPQTKQRRRSSPPSATRRPTSSRPRRTGTSKQSRFSRLHFRSEPEPTGIKRALATLKGSKAARGGAAASGLALVVGGWTALRKLRGGEPESVPGPVTHTPTPTPSVRPQARDAS